MFRFARRDYSFVILCCLVSMMIPAFAQGGLRYTITVTKFENQAGWRGHWSIGDAWGAAMTDLLNQSGKFTVLGETDMRNAAMNEQDLGASGRVAQGRKTPEIGQLTPAQLLVKGAITHVQHKTAGGKGGIRIKRLRLGGGKDTAEVNATIYVVDSTTGQVLASTNVVGKSDTKGANVGYSRSNWGANVAGYKKDNLGKAVEAAVAQAVDFISGQLPKVPWRGSVVMVRGDKVYINRGSREGVAVGREFSVGQMEVIRDPDTGEVLDESVTEIARLRADEVKEKLTICTVLSGDPSRISKGMGIQTPGS